MSRFFGRILRKKVLADFTLSNTTIACWKMWISFRLRFVYLTVVSRLVCSLRKSGISSRAWRPGRTRAGPTGTRCSNSCWTRRRARSPCSTAGRRSSAGCFGSSAISSGSTSGRKSFRRAIFAETKIKQRTERKKESENNRKNESKRATFHIVTILPVEDCQVRYQLPRPHSPLPSSQHISGHPTECFSSYIFTKKKKKTVTLQSYRWFLIIFF